MEIIKSDIKIKYERKIEGMGTGLALFKIDIINKNPNPKYHLFYENGWKPPVDVTMNINSFQIEYISFFAQDENIIEKELKNELTLVDSSSIKIVDSIFSENNYEKTIHREFNIFTRNNDIIMLSKDNQDRILAYPLNESNYILCNQNDDFIGVLMKQIQLSEINTLKKAKII